MEFIKNNKKRLIISLVIIVILIILIIFSNIENEIIKYNSKYYNETGTNYIIFKEDNSCEVGSYFDCTYEINEDNDIYLKYYENVYGVDFKHERYFTIDDIDNLINYKFILADIEFDMTEHIKWSTKFSKDNNVESDELEDSGEQLSYVNKEYNLLSLSNGNTATFEMFSDSSCSLDFSDFNNRNSGTEYMEVAYNSGQCSYIQNSDLDFTIFYNGYFNVNYYYKTGYSNSLNKQTIGSRNVMPEANITFTNDSYSSFEFNGGSFEIIGGEVYYAYYLTDEEREKQKEEDELIEEDENSEVDVNDSGSIETDSDNSSNNTNNESNNSSNESDNSNEPEVDYRAISKEKIDDITVEFSHVTLDVYSVKLIGDTSYVDTMSIDNGYYYYYQILHVEAENNGENCYDINIKDDYSYKRTINACFNFEAEVSEYEVRLVPDYNKCIVLLNNANIYSYDHYNYYQKVKCDVGNFYNTCDLLSLYGAHVSPGYHEMKVTNSYNVTQTIEFECKL